MKISQKIKALVNTTLTLSLLAPLMGCAPKSRSRLIQPPSQQLFSKDLEQLQQFDSEGAEELNKTYGDRFSKVFGGTQGRDLLNFFNERIKYIFSEQYLLDLGAIQKNQVLPPDVLASNFNKGYWAYNLREGHPAYIYIATTQYIITGPRQGFVVTGSAYKEQTTDNYPIPVQMRQAVLIHEARHSDCTGGISQEALEDFKNGGKKTALCMHEHMVCPETHYLQGINACDDHPWGAYSVGALFTLAQLKNKSLSDYDREALEAYFVDQKSRLIDFDFFEMLNGAKGEPDMTSQP